MDIVDIILPLYNPKGNWIDPMTQAMLSLHEYFDSHDCVLHFYIVDDGSRKEVFTPEITENLRKAAGDLNVLSYQPNRGKGYALRFGVNATKGDYQIYTDADFPFSHSCVVNTYERLKDGADVVMGVRGADYSKAIPPMRKLLSRSVRLLNRIILNIPSRYLDTQAGLKGFNRKGRLIFLKTSVDTFLFDTEFILLSWRTGLRIDTTKLKLRPNLLFSPMGTKVILRELRHFVRILFKHHLSFKRREKKKQDEQ